MSTKTAVITGASRGIGRATALRFAQNGYNIVLAARNASDLQAVVDEIGALGAVCEAVPVDVGAFAGAREVMDVARGRFNHIDVLVNNAGAAPLNPIAVMSDEAFTQAIAVNQQAVFAMTRAAWPLLSENGGGTIVNISSMASVDPFPGFAVYGACKAWVNLFTKAAADEGRPLNIRVFAVAPGAVETALLRENFPKLPQKNTLAPDAVAGLVHQLCGDVFQYSSGQTIFLRQN